MSDPRLRLSDPSAALPVQSGWRPLGRVLIDAGVITQADLLSALHMQASQKAPLGEILISEGLAPEQAVMKALAAQNGLYLADLAQEPPNGTLLDLMPAAFWLSHRIVPWMRLGPAVVIATARPDLLEDIRPHLPNGFGVIMKVVASEAQIMAALQIHFGRRLALEAERRVPARFSCRNWEGRKSARLVVICAGASAALAGAALIPMQLFTALSIFAVLTLFLITGLKILGAGAQLLGRLHAPPPACILPQHLPKVSVMVPLFHETEIATALIRRLDALSYPRALLDVVLVLEEQDTLTRQTLQATTLPGWIRVIAVPDIGSITTKPRALNYALDFCDGEIIGIWDAEDAPATDQIEQVVGALDQAAPDVVCVQGILDYYNPRSNWIARCFTIEYASWFRIILPGLDRLGLVIPLGGTTLFMKRWAIEELGGWDAHNVTEDADLGVRIARFGYRTLMLRTVTGEEANCRPWPWIKQRSRWLKGFLITYLVHMHHPVALYRDLGPKRFFGLQAFFVGTMAQFLLAPLLWSFWLVPFGLPHPIEGTLPAPVLVATAILFFTTELVNIVVGMIAVSGARHRFLVPWTFTLPLYFPMGCIASYKALYELFSAPFYWDKTQHGHAGADP